MDTLFARCNSGSNFGSYLFTILFSSEFYDLASSGLVVYGGWVWGKVSRNWLKERNKRNWYGKLSCGVEVWAFVRGSHGVVICSCIGRMRKKRNFQDMFSIRWGKGKTTKSWHEKLSGCEARRWPEAEVLALWACNWVVFLVWFLELSRIAVNSEATELNLDAFHLLGVLDPLVWENSFTGSSSLNWLISSWSFIKWWGS